MSSNSDPLEASFNEGFHQIDQPKENQSFDDWFKQYDGDQKMIESETGIQTMGRRAGQFGARAAETVLGYPGNTKKAFKQVIDFIGSIIPSLKHPEDSVREPGDVEKFVMNPPGSQDIRESGTKQVAEAISGNKEYLEPKSEGEKAIGELTQDLTSFFMPGTGQLRLATRLGAPIAGNLTKQGLKYLGVEEEKAEKAKLGTMLMSSIALQSQPGQHASQMIRDSKAMVPQGMTVPGGPIAQRLLPLYQRLQRGFRGVPSKSRAMEGMGDIADQLRQGNGRMDMQSLLSMRDDINEWISEAGGWDVPIPTRDRTMANLNSLKRSVIETIDENMQRISPQAAEMYRGGYESAAVTHQSNAISSFIERNFGRKAASIGAKVLFPGLATGGIMIAPKIAAAGIAGYPLYSLGKVMYRVGRSPTLARYYQDVITASTIGNAAAMSKAMEKFDKAMVEDEKKERKTNGISLQEFKDSF